MSSCCGMGAGESLESKSIRKQTERTLPMCRHFNTLETIFLAHAVLRAYCLTFYCFIWRLGWGGVESGKKPKPKEIFICRPAMPAK